MWNLVGNPKDQFSHNKAHFISNINENNKFMSTMFFLFIFFIKAMPILNKIGMKLPLFISDMTVFTLR